MFNEETELDRLYAAPLEEFTKLRNEIGGQARKDGDQAVATRIGALKKPSVSAWVVNQLARTGQVELQRLIKAGEALEEAQRDSVSGKGPSGFETARKDESDAIRLLRAAVKQVLPSVSAAVLDRVINSLRAGVASPEGREILKKGRLTEDLEPSGFGAFSGIPTSSLTKPSKIDTLRRRRQEAETKATDLEMRAQEAEKLAKRTSMDAAAARKRAGEALAQLQKIEGELADLD
ncbi:MAG: hypothetical protein WD354_06020 [Acidimicrobiia bacterium]